MTTHVHEPIQNVRHNQPVDEWFCGDCLEKLPKPNRTPATEAGRAFAHDQYTRKFSRDWTPEEFVDRILEIEDQARMLDTFTVAVRGADARVLTDEEWAAIPQPAEWVRWFDLTDIPPGSTVKSATLTIDGRTADVTEEVARSVPTRPDEPLGEDPGSCPRCGVHWSNHPEAHGPDEPLTVAAALAALADALDPWVLWMGTSRQPSDWGPVVDAHAEARATLAALGTSEGEAS